MHSKYWLVTIVSGVLMACGGKSTPEAQTPEPAPAGTSAPVPEAPTAAATEQPSAQMPPGPVTATPEGPVVVVVEPPPTPFSDGQIAAITDAANSSEVEQATLAQSRARDARVKKFATMMITDHSAAKRQQADLVARVGITSVDSKRSTAMKEESNRAIESLKALNRNEFDRAYIDLQVDGHQKVLDSFDNELIPNAKNADFKAALVEFRPTVEHHLREAQDIQQSLASAPSPVGKAEPQRSGQSASLGGTPKATK